VHAAPASFKPQELAMQVLGGTQSVASVAVVQPALHAPAAQAKVPQDWLAGVRQAPLPSHVEGGVTEAEVAQTAAAQFWPCS
jgi:hypothetical protein